MATFTEQSDYVLSSLADRANTAETLLNITKTLIDQVRTGITTMLDGYSTLGVIVEVGGVDTNYTTPSVGVVELPSSGSVAVTISNPVSTVYAGSAAYIPPIQPTIDISVLEVDTDFQVSNTAYPVSPPRYSILVEGNEWNEIFERAANNALRASAAEEQVATNEASLRGMAVPGVVSNGMLSASRQRAMDRISEVALTKAVENAIMLREDTVKVHEMEVSAWSSTEKRYLENQNTRLQYENLELKKAIDPVAAEGRYAADAGAVNVDAYAQASKLNIESELARLQFGQFSLKQQFDPAAKTTDNLLALGKLSVEQYGARIQGHVTSEEARLKFEALELDKNLKPEAIRAEYDMKLTELAQANAVAQLVDLIQVYAQLTNALYSASDVSQSSGASIGVSYPFKYNPTAGDVVINAA